MRVELKDLVNGSVKCADANAFLVDAQKVVDVLSSVSEQMRCKEIANLILSESWSGRKYPMSVGHCAKVLTALVGSGVVKRVEVDGEPIEIDAYGYGYDGADKIHINGVTYIREGAKETWGRHKKTITPKIAYFSIA